LGRNPQGWQKRTVIWRGKTAKEEGAGRALPNRKETDQVRKEGTQALTDGQTRPLITQEEKMGNFKGGKPKKFRMSLRMKPGRKGIERFFSKGITYKERRRMPWSVRQNSLIHQFHDLWG